MIKLILILIMIESGGDPNEVGDGGKAVGILQIHPIMVKECNRILGREEFILEDRKDKTKSIQMCSVFLSYQKSRHPEASYQRLGEVWNTGVWKKRSAEYAEKIRKLW